MFDYNHYFLWVDFMSFSSMLFSLIREHLRPKALLGTLTTLFRDESFNEKIEGKGRKEGTDGQSCRP